MTNTARLQRLARFLQEDPHNPALLADAFAAALEAGAHATALQHLQTAQDAGLHGRDWTLRRAHLDIAMRELERAAALLESLRLQEGNDVVVAHLAYVRFLQGRNAECRELLAPWMKAAAATGATTAHDELDALQVLWLRACHRDHLLDEAWTWVRAAHSCNVLRPRAMGVAALVAVDRSDFAQARALGEQALGSEACTPEGFVASACVALAERNGSRARELLQRALALHGDDGRVHGTMGMACLLLRDLPAAQAHLETATARVPRHVGTWHALGWTQLLRGDRVGALAAFRRALDLDRNFAESHGAVGLLLGLEGQHAEALRHLQLADRLAPTNVTARYARALLAGEAGDATRLDALASRLLDRPGFFGGRLSDGLAVRSVDPA